jgi:hypothetical protein
MMVLRNVPVVEIRDPEIQKNIEEKREIENNEIEPVIRNPGDILNIPVDCKNPDRLDQQVQRQQQAKVCQKFPLHKVYINRFPKETLLSLRKNSDICYKVKN